MPKEILKVTGKSRLYDDVEDGITYKVTMTYKVGKKGLPGYEKVRLVVEAGSISFYETVDAGDELVVEFKPAVKKLTEFSD